MAIVLKHSPVSFPDPQPEPPSSPTPERRDTRAELFDSSTVDVDFTFMQQQFVSKLVPGAKVLDFGCGSGHDAKTFLDAGFDVTAIEESAELCCIASQLTGLPVRQELPLDFSDVEAYDGIWACSSLPHLTRSDLALVLDKMADALKPNGIIMTSFRNGTFEGARDGRQCTDFTLPAFIGFMADIPKLEIEGGWEIVTAHHAGENDRRLDFLLRKV